MMLQALFVLVAASAPPTFAADEPGEKHPFAGVVEGDHFKFERTVTIFKKVTKETISRTIDEVSKKKKMVFVAEVIVVGEKKREREVQIDLSKAPAPELLASSTMMARGKWKQQSEGREKLPIGAREYDCTWVKSALVDDSGKMSGELTIWSCREVPWAVKVQLSVKDQKGVEYISESVRLTEIGREP